MFCRVFYTVPSRLVGRRLRIRQYEDRIEPSPPHHPAARATRAGPRRPQPPHRRLPPCCHVIHSLGARQARRAGPTGLARHALATPRLRPSLGRAHHATALPGLVTLPTKKSATGLSQREPPSSNEAHGRPVVLDLREDERGRHGSDVVIAREKNAMTPAVRTVRSPAFGVCAAISLTPPSHRPRESRHGIRPSGPSARPHCAR